MSDQILAAAAYAIAKSYTMDHFPEEVRWQHTIRFDDVTESDFLREAAWVILCSGFRERTLRMCFNYLSLCFCDWESGAAIAENADACRTAALAAFNNARKVDAIIQTARRVGRDGFPAFKRQILCHPMETLQMLPYIGPVTVYHLAKNLGLPVAKPDRHLQRLATKLSYPDAHRLCGDVAALTGDPPQVVDLIFWRYLAETQGSGQIAPRPKRPASR